MAANPPPPRTRSARLTLISLLLIPLLSLAALWGFTASITLGNVIRDQNYNTIENAIAPSITAFGLTLQGERAVTLAWLGANRQSPLMQTQMQVIRHTTDKYVAAAHKAISSVRPLVSQAAAARLDAFLVTLGTLGKIRATVDSGAYDQVQAFNAYSGVSAAEYSYFNIPSPPSAPALSLMTHSALAAARAQ